MQMFVCVKVQSFWIIEDSVDIVQVQVTLFLCVCIGGKLLTAQGLFYLKI